MPTISSSSKSRTESRKRWVEKNRDAYLQHRRDYWAKNRERLVEQQRQIQLKRKELMNEEYKYDPESLFYSAKLVNIINGDYNE